MQPPRRIDLAGSMLGWPGWYATGTSGWMGPLPRAGRHGRRTRLDEVLVVQLTKFGAQSHFGNRRIGRSVACASSSTSFTSLLLALRFVRRNRWRLRATARMQVLEVSFEVLSAIVGEPG